MRSMKCLKLVFASALALMAATGCAAKRQWSVPADLSRGDATTLVGEAAKAGELGRLLEHAEATVFDVDEERMAELLRAALATGKLSDSQKATAEWMLHDVCEVNARGAVATDFRFATAEASENRLLTFAQGEPLLMLLYNPDCDHCRQVIKELSAMEGLPQVLAVCIEAPAKRWEATRGQLPAEWTAAYDRSGIMENDLYIIRQLPSIYLLSGDRRIELKNPAMSALKERFSQK